MNKSFTERFLEYYKRYPCLWDPRHKGYGNRTVRINALKSIIKDMRLNISITDVRIRIKSIRDVYTREVKKILDSKKKGGEIYKPILRWFPTADRFLRPIIGTPRGKVHQLKGEDSTSETENSASTSRNKLEESFAAYSSDSCSAGEPEYQYFSDEMELHTTDTYITKVEPGQMKHNLLTPKKTKKSQNINQPQITPPVQEDKNDDFNSQKIRPDEFDTFGQHVANQLRSLPITNAIMCQNFINNYLSEERLKLLNAENVKPEVVYYTDAEVASD